VTAGITWTHLFTQRVTDASGVTHDYAGTHGNCDVTNCMGSPRDRVSFAGTWEYGPGRLGANVNYRGSMSNKFEQSDTECAQTTANGNDFPGGCRVSSFTTSTCRRPGSSARTSKSSARSPISSIASRRSTSDLRRDRLQPARLLGAIGRFYRIGAKYAF